MQIVRKNTSKTDRDPNIYLGIDGAGIHKDKFYYSELYECGFYTFATYSLCETQIFLEYRDNYFYIESKNPNIYLSEEDLKIPLLHDFTSNCNNSNYRKGFEKIKLRKENGAIEITLPKSCKTIEDFEEALRLDINGIYNEGRRWLYNIHVKSEELWVSIFKQFFKETESSSNKMFIPQYGILIKDF